MGVTEPKLTVFGQGQTLFRQGEKGGELFFLKEGKVEISVRHERTGETAVVATLGDRSVLGTMSFLDNSARTATAKALTEVKCIVVTQMQRERLIADIPQWFQVLFKDMCAQMERLNHEYIRLTSKCEALEKKLAAAAPPVPPSPPAGDAPPGP
jgi:CRP-like cAMP-binding protein